MTFVLRYPARRVHTVALWVIRPPEHQRLEEVERHGVRVRVTSLVLRELPAELLLSDARTACFAAGADAGQLSDDDLCDAIVKRLQEAAADKRQFEIAAVLATTTGRYGAMVSSMQRAKVETVILEDLVHFGEDRGFEKGLERGRSMLASTLLAILAARGLDPASEARARIDAERSADVLRRWCIRASTAGSVAEVLAD
jgi:hypothetical protein